LEELWSVRLGSRRDRRSRFSRRGFLRGAAGLAAAGILVRAPVADASLLRLPARRSASLQLPPNGESIVARVVPDVLELRAYPNADSVVRRRARAGDLLRVIGRAPGVDRDPHTWWATTDGFVQPLEALEPADGPAVESWTLPEAGLAAKGWWGEITAPARVRAFADTDAPIVGNFDPGQRIKALVQEQGRAVEGDPTWYRIDGGRFAGGRVHSSLIRAIYQPEPNTTRPPGLSNASTWVTIDRGAGTLTYVRDGNPEFVTFAAIGRVAVETPAGLYAVRQKLLFDEMSSARNPGADRAYHLPNVPSVIYFHREGYAIHGTYWHDQFGSQESQGCVNLTVTDGAYLFELTAPKLADGQSGVWAGSVATPIVIVG
jgi:hypothetical protein